MHGEAKTADPSDSSAPERILGSAPERILGEDGGRAYRRFVDWMIGAGFALAVLEVTTPRRRNELIAWTKGQVPGTRVVGMDEASGQPLRPVLDKACAPPGEAALLILTRLEEATERTKLLARLNVQRDELARDYALPWVILIHPSAALELQMRAPDLAHFAGLWLKEEGPAGPIEFGQIMGLQPTMVVSTNFDRLIEDTNQRTNEQLVRVHGAWSGASALLGQAEEAIMLSRYDEAADFLARHDFYHPDAQSDDAERIRLDGLLSWFRGEPMRAMTRFETALRLTADPRLQATLLAEIARVHTLHGDMKTALDLYQQALKQFEELGEIRSRAVTLGEIADILEVQGQLDQALRIHREQVLPVFEQFGDDRSRAFQRGKIADILLDRGQFDEALRIHREELLPVYERLGDTRLRADTLRRIAEILQHEGQSNEALRTLREQALPIYEQLGDARLCAGTMSQIADILQHQGQLDEALRIHREQVLPVYEQLGDLRGRAITMGRVADILHRQGQLEKALRIRREKELPIYEQLGDVREHAVTMSKIADILEARGQVDEALRILREQVLPVFDRIGHVRYLAVGRANLGLLYLQRGHPGDVEEAAHLLQRALSDAEQSRIPEAEQIRTLLAAARR